MTIGLYFGSFNPVHIGHLAIANYMVEFTDIEQLWFVISPQNPLKQKRTLLQDSFRYDMLELAIGNDPRFRISDIEFRLPKPSYTTNTLAYIKEQYPAYEFALIMGSDNLNTFLKWKNWEWIENNYKRYVYPRPCISEIDPNEHKNIIMADAPFIEISSSFIRESIKKGKDVRYFLPERVYDYIIKMKFYV